MSGPSSVLYGLSLQFRMRSKFAAYTWRAVIIPLLLCKTSSISLSRAWLFARRRGRYTTWLRRNFGGHDHDEALAAWTPRALSVLRIITGLMIIQHGMAKLIGFPAVPAFANLQPLSLIGAAGFIELIGGALLILGLCTQPVAFILAGEMAFAYFMVHCAEGLSSR